MFGFGLAWLFRSVASSLVVFISSSGQVAKHLNKRYSSILNFIIIIGVYVNLHIKKD